MVLISPEIYAWVILPLLIFSARVIDVAFGTLRILFVSKGLKLFAALVAFFEILIWVLAIVQIMKDLTNVINYFAYAGGFAIGTSVGITIEEKLAVGLTSIWIVTEEDATELINHLLSKKYVVESVGAQGLEGEVRIVFTIMKRKDLKDIINVVKRFNPRAFVSVSDIRSINVRTTGLAEKRVFSLSKLRNFRIGTIKSHRKAK